MGLYFFVGDSKHDHFRSVYNFSDVLSSVGGIAASIFSIFSVIGTIYNQQVYTQHLLHLLYFIKDEDASTHKLKKDWRI